MSADQTAVKVTFTYYPDEPDPDDATGMAEEEYIRLTDRLTALRADDLRIEKD